MFINFFEIVRNGFKSSGEDKNTWLVDWRRVKNIILQQHFTSARFLKYFSGNGSWK